MRCQVEKIYRPHVLRPFNSAEAMSTTEAAKMAGIAPRTMRDLCLNRPIARQILGHWKVSKPALQMLLDGNDAALKAYASGDRTSSLVTDYFRASGILDRCE